MSIMYVCMQTRTYTFNFELIGFEVLGAEDEEAEKETSYFEMCIFPWIYKLNVMQTCELFCYKPSIGGIAKQKLAPC